MNAKKKTPPRPTAEKPVELVCVVDKSGSMASVKDDAIGGFNHFLEEQQKLPGEAIMTLVLFDTEYTLQQNGVPLKEAKPLDETSYSPGGNTALLDAVGKTLADISARHRSLPDQARPEKVMVMVLTDGHENSSHEYTREAVRKMVEERETAGWKFIFQGAGIEKFDDAHSMGMMATQGAAHSGAGLASLYQSSSNLAKAYRSSR